MAKGNLSNSQYFFIKTRTWDRNSKTHETLIVDPVSLSRGGMLLSRDVISRGGIPSESDTLSLLPVRVSTHCAVAFHGRM